MITVLRCENSVRGPVKRDDGLPEFVLGTHKEVADFFRREFVETTEQPTIRTYLEETAKAIEEGRGDQVSYDLAAYGYAVYVGEQK